MHMKGALRSPVSLSHLHLHEYENLKSAVPLLPVLENALRESGHGFRAFHSVATFSVDLCSADN